MLRELFERIFPRPVLKMYPDELPTILQYQKRRQRTDPQGWATIESSAKIAKPGITIDWSDSEKPIKMTVEIGSR